MTISIDPLADVPAHLHDLMPPYLAVGIRLGRVVAEQAVAVSPLPWSEDLAAFVVSESIAVLDDDVRKHMPDLPQAVITAMHRQLVNSLSDRLDELLDAAGSQPQGGRA